MELYQAVLDDLRVRIARLEVELEARNAPVELWREYYQAADCLEDAEFTHDVSRTIDGL